MVTMLTRDLSVDRGEFSASKQRVGRWRASGEGKTGDAPEEAGEGRRKETDACCPERSHSAQKTLKVAEYNFIRARVAAVQRFSRRARQPKPKGVFEKAISVFSISISTGWMWNGRGRVLAVYHE